MSFVRMKRIVHIQEPGFVYYGESAAGGHAQTAARAWSIAAARCRIAVEKALPDTCAELYVNLGPTGRHLVGAEELATATAPRAAWVVGPHANPLFIAKETADCAVVALRLQPGVIATVLGVPAASLGAQLVDLDQFWGRAAVDQLCESLLIAHSPRRRVRILHDEVARRWRAAAQSAPNVRRLCCAIEDVPNTSVGEIARRFGLSHRRVIALFDEHIGLKPKAFQRVRRLRRVLERVTARPVTSWARLACEAGYCDQAHLVNEFRRLTGITPTVYERTRSIVGEGVVPHVLAHAG